MNEWAEFRHFRYLLAIVQHEGFRAAAEYLHTAQPNLSAQAKQFQDLSNVHLFQRCKDGRIKLTKTGIAFERLAQLVLDTRDEVIAALFAIEHDDVPSLRLGCTSLIDQELFHACCQLHKEILPDCPILPTHGDMAQLEEELTSGEIDAAVVTLPVISPRLQVEVIRTDRLVVACGAITRLLQSLSSSRPIYKTISQFFITRNGISTRTTVSGNICESWVLKWNAIQERIIRPN
jgi:DNA-binding transcriptional LysR family regulator